MHFRIVCLIKFVSAVRLDWVLAHDAFKFCTSYVHAFFKHMFFLSFLFWTCVLFSLSLSLSDRLLYGTQTMQIHSGSEPSSWFRIILFRSISYPVLWWEVQDGLLWEFSGPWCSSGMLGHPIGFLWHCSTRSHSDSWMGVPLWEVREVSGRVHEWRRMILQLLLFHLLLWLLPPTFLLPRQLMRPSRPSWHSFNGWRLTLVVVLTISQMRCVKWTPESVALPVDKLALMSTRSKTFLKNE